MLFLTTLYLSSEEKKLKGRYVQRSLVAILYVSEPA